MRHRLAGQQTLYRLWVMAKLPPPRWRTIRAGGHRVLLGGPGARSCLPCRVPLVLPTLPGSTPAVGLSLDRPHWAPSEGPGERAKCWALSKERGAATPSAHAARAFPRPPWPRGGPPTTAPTAEGRVGPPPPYSLHPCHPLLAAHQPGPSQAGPPAIKQSSYWACVSSRALGQPCSSLINSLSAQPRPWGGGGWTTRTECPQLQQGQGVADHTAMGRGSRSAGTADGLPTLASRHQGPRLLVQEPSLAQPPLLL